MYWRGGEKDGVGKAAAGAWLDEYAHVNGTKRGREAADSIKSLINGEVDWNGNPIEPDDEEDDDYYKKWRESFLRRYLHGKKHM